MLPVNDSERTGNGAAGKHPNGRRVGGVETEWGLGTLAGRLRTYAKELPEGRQQADLLRAAMVAQQARMVGQSLDASPKTAEAKIQNEFWRMAYAYHAVAGERDDLERQRIAAEIEEPGGARSRGPYAASKRAAIWAALNNHDNTGRSQGDIARELGVSQSTVSRAERHFRRAAHPLDRLIYSAKSLVRPREREPGHE